MLRIAVITVSDRAARSEYADRSGPAICEILKEKFPDCEIAAETVPDEKEIIRSALDKYSQYDYILTSGGTGVSPRDVTPEATHEACEREVPGIAEWLRRESEKETPYAVFSRAFCGIRGNSIIINLPGSARAAAFCTRLLVKILEHGQQMLRGEGH